MNGVAQSDQIVVRNLGVFFEAFLGRKLSGSESLEVTNEFIKFHTSNGKDRAAIHESARAFGAYAKILREQKGSPAEFTLRYLLIQANYFLPSMQNTTELGLLAEPVPLRVVNSQSKRLMT